MLSIGAVEIGDSLQAASTSSSHSRYDSSGSSSSS